MMSQVRSQLRREGHVVAGTAGKRELFLPRRQDPSQATRILHPLRDTIIRSLRPLHKVHRFGTCIQIDH